MKSASGPPSITEDLRAKLRQVRKIIHFSHRVIGVIPGRFEGFLRGKTQKTLGNFRDDIRTIKDMVLLYLMTQVLRKKNYFQVGLGGLKASRSITPHTGQFRENFLKINFWAKNVQKFAFLMVNQKIQVLSGHQVLEKLKL